VQLVHLAVGIAIYCNWGWIVFGALLVCLVVAAMAALVVV
jgi:hypothetical protein